MNGMREVNGRALDWVSQYRLLPLHCILVDCLEFDAATKEGV